MFIQYRFLIPQEWPMKMCSVHQPELLHCVGHSNKNLASIERYITKGGQH